MDQVSDAELRAIRERCACATPGPWWSWVEGRDGLSGDTFIGRGVDGARHGDLYLSTDPGETISVADLDFIAGARQDVPRLLAEVERVQRLLADRQ